MCEQLPGQMDIFDFLPKEVDTEKTVNTIATNERTNERTNRPLRVLVACEESQEVCTAFREHGHEAYSCDLEECSGGHPEWHIIADVVPLLDGDVTFVTCDGAMHKIDGKWDLIIAHPPCTYLTNGGAVRVFRKETKECPPYGTFQMVNVERIKLGILARSFFMRIFLARCDRIAIENPIPMSVFMLPKADQVIQPYMFGEPWSKKTCLWLKGLSPLTPTNIVDDYHPYINGGGGRMERPNYKGVHNNWGTSVHRSKTFPGVARAMAEQWGGNCGNEP